MHTPSSNRYVQAAAQFGRLGEESARLLAACEAERALRAKLEAGLQIKERQVLAPSRSRSLSLSLCLSLSRSLSLSLSPSLVLCM